MSVCKLHAFVLAICLYVSGPVQGQGALAGTGRGMLAGNSDLVMFEARLVPQTCETPVQCLPQSQLILRNLASLKTEETVEIMSFLNRISAVRGIPAQGVDGLNMSIPVLSHNLHDIEKTEKIDLLRDHPGMYFDSAALDKTEDSANFGDFIRVQFQQAGVRFLSEAEMNATAGRPRLTVRYSARRESEGCIIPFSIVMKLEEETVLVRNPDLKTTSTIWSGTARQNLANRNYTSQSALREIVSCFLDDWRKANTP